MRLLACLALVLSSSTALAEGDDEPRCVMEGEAVPVKFHVENRGGERVVVIDREIIMCGHPPRPNVAYVHTAKSVNYEWETLEQDFLPAILRSIAKGPF
jgi:hypothetical protein